MSSVVITIDLEGMAGPEVKVKVKKRLKRLVKSKKKKN
jgi:hypothetical protein